MGREPGKGVRRLLEGRAEALAGTFKAQEVANILWAYATMGREPGKGLMTELEGRLEALAGTFIAQEVANTLWAYATMGQEPGKGLMRLLEGRAEALAGTFKAHDVANTLWAACVFSLLRPPGEGRRWVPALVQTVVQRLVSLGNSACFNTAELRQLHQFFVCCSVDPRFCVDANVGMRTLRETCRAAFEGERTAPSKTQQQVSETLRQMGLSVEDEVRCPSSGYSIVYVHESCWGMGGERSSSTSTWAVEFDGPSHFLTSRAPTGATLLKRRHLQLLGHALVTVPCWEWAACEGAGERVQYLRVKLEQLRNVPRLDAVHTCVAVTAPSSGDLKQKPQVSLQHRPRSTYAPTQISQEEKKEEEAAVEVGAADVWELRESKTRKRPYYFNRRTGEARWEAPRTVLATVLEAEAPAMNLGKRQSALDDSGGGFQSYGQHARQFSPLPVQHQPFQQSYHALSPFAKHGRRSPSTDM
jgi:hypothetical protein